MPIFVSHYTIHTPYQKEIEKLKQSLIKFDLDYDLEGIKPKGTWRANSNWCAWQVQKALKYYPGRDIVRVDADAIIQRYPSYFTDFDFDADIAACVWKASRLRPGGEFLGGTMYFANNERTRFIVDEWVKQSELTPTYRNGDMLETIIQKNKEKIRFGKLPLAYCKIFDFMRNEVDEPVIEHFQASRKYKGLMNTKVG